MTVNDLRLVLRDLDTDMEIFIQIDPEGNGYHRMRGIDSDCLLDEDDVYSSDWSYEDACFDSEDEWKEFLSTSQKIAVIYP